MTRGERIVNSEMPPAGRCHDFGRAVVKAIRHWKTKARVARFASGGLSHFVIEEQMDRAFLHALRERSAADSTGLREQLLHSGNSEIKNWIALGGRTSEIGRGFELVDYVPCDGSEAGAGTANAFVAWRYPRCLTRSGRALRDEPEFFRASPAAADTFGFAMAR